VNNGARLRDYYLARELATRASVTYFGLKYPGEQDSGPSAGDLAPPEEIFERVVVIEKPAAYDPVNLLRGLIGPVPATVLNNMNSEIPETLAKFGRGGAFDSVQVEGVHLAPYVRVVRAFPQSPAMICDWHNIESELMRRYIETSPSLPRRLYAGRTASLLERTERELLRACDVHTVVSEREKQKLQAIVPDASIHVVENGVDTAFFSDARIDLAHQQSSLADGELGSVKRDRLVYAGSMDYHANIDAVRWFARDIWPALRERQPNLRFTIVGRNPSPEVIALKSTDIDVTGTVPDVRPYYREAIAVVVPLRAGSGTRLKILEAMAAGVPVVSTTLGAEGLEARPGCELLIADAPSEMADAIVAVIQPAELRAKLIAAGRALVERRYDWRALGEQLYSIHQAAHQAARTGSRSVGPS
jgi:glycosyltransferase involved in cell wall biosynthesis